MTDVGQITVKVDADTAKLDKGLKGTRERLKKLDTDVKAISGTFSKAFGVALVGAGAAAVKLASDAEEVRSKLNTVFGAAAGDAIQFAEDTAKATNRSKFALEGYLATLQDTFKPLGFAADQATAMSKEVTALAIDLASFNNLNTEDVVRDLQSALVGNTETLRKYGVVANQAAIDQEALALGLEFTKGKMDGQSKAAAIMSLAIKGTTDAQGDAIRTSDSFANQLRGLQAEIENTAVQIGQELIPIVKTLLPVLSGAARGAIKVFKGFQLAVNEVTREILEFKAAGIAAIKSLNPFADQKRIQAELADEFERLAAAARIGRDEILGEAKALTDVGNTLGVVEQRSNEVNASLAKAPDHVAATNEKAEDLKLTFADLRDLARGFEEDLSSLGGEMELLQSEFSALDEVASGAVDTSPGGGGGGGDAGGGGVTQGQGLGAIPEPGTATDLLNSALSQPSQSDQELAAVGRQGINRRTNLLHKLNPNATASQLLWGADRLADLSDGLFGNSSGKRPIKRRKFKERFAKGNNLKDFSKFNSSDGKDMSKVTSASQFMNELRGSLGVRFNGGFVQAGQPVIVGENRPEVFVPNTSGVVNPMQQGMGGLGNVTINVNGSGSPIETAQRVKIAMEQLLRTGDMQNITQRALA